jgi:hypothetical protein
MAGAVMDARGLGDDEPASPLGTLRKEVMPESPWGPIYAITELGTPGEPGIPRAR